MTPASAREQLLAKLQAVPRFRKWDTAAMASRIARMTDQQVYAALAMSDEEIEAEPDRKPQYAPATEPTPTLLWEHVDPRWA